MMWENLGNIDQDEEPCDDIENSIIETLKNPLESANNYKVSRSSMLQLSSVSNLYIYTNPPPVGYGSPGPKVAESVSRSLSFNKKEECLREGKVGPFTVNRGFWEEENRPYPFNETTGNWHPGECYRMFQHLAVKYKDEIQQCSEATLDYMLKKNATLLTQGRQTWDPLNETSSPSPTAYLECIKWLKVNNFTTDHSLFTFTQLLHEQKEQLTFPQHNHEPKRVRHFDKAHLQYVTRCINKRTTKHLTIKGEEKCQQALLEMASTFCSYIKHGERGKLKRRAIASPNILLRAYLNIIEFFHLELSKKLPGTTISIGGDEKKQKILKELSRKTGSHLQKEFTGTQDATKFNECMNADLFAMMHLVFFNHKGINQTNTQKILCTIFTEGNFLLAIKRITLGPGPVCINKTTHIMNQPSYTPENLIHFNNSTKTWINNLQGKFSNDRKYILAPSGMLMGMHNAAATVVAYAGCNWRQDNASVQYTTLRSSDDSLTYIAAIDNANILSAIYTEYNTMKMLGINLALSKSYWISGTFGEYNSWYIDGNFTSQYGTETSAMRPQGINPGDDFHTCASGVSTALSQHIINPFGAQMRLIVGINHIRRVWRIELNPRESINPKVQFLGDGGYSPWSCMNASCDEFSLRVYWAQGKDAEMSYIKKCVNPENPFSAEPNEEFTYNKDVGKMVITEIDTPRTIFHYTQRHNRTFRGPKAEENKKNLSHVSGATQILDFANPAFKVLSYQSDMLCSKYLDDIMTTFLTSNESQLTEDEKETIRKAIRATNPDLDEEHESEGEDNEWISDSELEI